MFTDEDTPGSSPAEIHGHADVKYSRIRGAGDDEDLDRRIASRLYQTCKQDLGWVAGALFGVVEYGNF